MLVGVVLAFLLPQQVYLFLVSSSGFIPLFTYLMIMASHLVIRGREGCPTLGCKLPGYPYSSWLGIVLLVGSLAAMPLVPGQGAGLLTGLGLLLFFVVAFGLVGTRPPAGLKRVEARREESSEQSSDLVLR